MHAQDRLSIGGIVIPSARIGSATKVEHVAVSESKSLSIGATSYMLNGLARVPVTLSKFPVPLKYQHL
jgi:hypothetical protein